VLDIDGTLWFLALDNALVNNDGYWIRASDYSIFRDEQGKFHIIPHDTNETFNQMPVSDRQAGALGRGGPGFGRGGVRGGGGPGLGDGEVPVAAPAGAREQTRAAEVGRPASSFDPLCWFERRSKPLRSRLLAVPALRARYLAHVRTIAEEWLDWKQAQTRRRSISFVDREGGRGRYPQIDFVCGLPEGRG